MKKDTDDFHTAVFIFLPGKIQIVLSSSCLDHDTNSMIYNINHDCGDWYQQICNCISLIRDCK